MSGGGLVKARLERMHEVLGGCVERKIVPGLVALVGHGEDVHVEALGSLDFDQAAPMKRDAIFRIASLSKVITAVAAMILVEDCKLRLDEPIDKWLPELANRRVLKNMASPIEETVAAKRAITVRDLFTYRMGFGSVMAAPGTYPIQKFMKDFLVGGDGPYAPDYYPTMDEWLKKLGSLPLMAQPGEKWMYNTSGDVLGALVARAAEMPLGEFMRVHIFEPLGMKDTGFWVPPEKIKRMPAFYYYDRKKNGLAYFDDPAATAWRRQPAFESGAGGMVSTIDDYFAFSRMLLNGGRHGREQILSRASVEMMTENQLTPENRAGAGIFFGDYASWGMGFAVYTKRTEIFQTPGRYGWDGGFGTSAYNDPANGLIGILFTQRMMDSPEPPTVFWDFWTLAYAAME